MPIMILTKNTEWCRQAQRFITGHLKDAIVFEGQVGDPFPEEALSWTGGYLISFLCPWVVPAEILARADRAAINFHPAPPEYPGIGCYNFALYDEVAEYGVTCHHMAHRVDTGPIIKIVRFPLLAGDNVALLKERSMVHLLALFYEICALIVQDLELPVSAEVWRREPYTRRQLDALCEIRPDMPRDEIKRRIRATHFPGYPGPYVELGGKRFIYP